MAVAGNIVRTVHLYLDGLDPEAPLTGQTSPANITFQLMRDTGAAMVAASETIAFSETATAGYYNISFTPQNSGLYTLFAVELAGGQRQPRWDFQVLSAGAIFAPSYQNAFCSESDIERWINASITATTSPTDTEAGAFAESRAARLMALTARLGYAVTPASVTAASILEDLLREANAIGAALDYLTAQKRDLAPFDPGRGRLSVLGDLWNQLAGYHLSGYYAGNSWIPGEIEHLIRGTLLSLSTDHILSGDTTAPTTTTPVGQGIQVSMGDVY